MTIIPTAMLVVAAALYDPQERLLLQQCPVGKRHAGLWEFPGGKIENEETPRLALAREIEEELGIRLNNAALVPAGFADESAHSECPAIVLLLYSCSEWEGEPKGLEGQQWRWFDRREAEALAMPPMDRQLLENLAPMGIANR